MDLVAHVLQALACCITSLIAPVLAKPADSAFKLDYVDSLAQALQSGGHTFMDRTGYDF